MKKAWNLQTDMNQIKPNNVGRVRTQVARCKKNKKKQDKTKQKHALTAIVIKSLSFPELIS